MTPLDSLAASHHAGQPRGLPSICSAHPLVIEAALQHGRTQPRPVLIEATCNQVNQFGGYTGMTPADFARFVQETADRLGFPRSRLILGGDHLGPLPWADEPAERAMQKASDLVRAFVQAGFTKVHLDCSMPLGGESDLPLEVIARRTAQLARVAEQAAGFTHPSTIHRPPSIVRRPLRYVIGSEVPPAGGARAGAGRLAVTSPEAAADTLAAARRAFHEQGLDSAWERVRALVVQPGVEFGDDFVHDYDRAAAAPLARFIETVPGLVYEAHSTDYQTPAALRALVEDHFAILKVGPALTFALREAVFALAAIEAELLPAAARSHIVRVLEQAMLRNPGYWEKYYRGSEQERRLKRKFSLSDRIRYYWADPQVRAAFERLLRNLEGKPLPLALVSQYLPRQYARLRSGEVEPLASTLLRDHIHDVLRDYDFACGPSAS
ncbi:MAG: D-tagatose-bisphosphate aldolase, class II, non-catalytic subunit [Anaerolineales bacterium]